MSVTGLRRGEGRRLSEPAAALCWVCRTAHRSTFLTALRCNPEHAEPERQLQVHRALHLSKLPSGGCPLGLDHRPLDRMPVRVVLDPVHHPTQSAISCTPHLWGKETTARDDAPARRVAGCRCDRMAIATWHRVPVGFGS